MLAMWTEEGERGRRYDILEVRMAHFMGLTGWCWIHSGKSNIKFSVVAN
jgi:hypothetical protein